MLNNMTALVSLFVRCYHTKFSNIKIYNDPLAEKIITEEEYQSIATNMAKGIEFFNKDYKGNDPLKWIVNNQLSPSVLARSAFNEKHLLNEISLGLKQYLILASGYDTSFYKVKDKVKVFELDKEEMIEDKIRRLKKAHINNDNITYIGCDLTTDWISILLKSLYKKEEKTFCSLLGISYYLTKEAFTNVIKILAENIPKGSAIVFDFPNEFVTSKEIINEKLASSAKEPMQSKYSLSDIMSIADKSNLQMYELVSSKEINETYFYDYNTLNPDDLIIAPDGVSYCLLIKQ